MLQGTFCCKLSRNARSCGDAGIDSKCFDPDASGNGRECCWACKETLSTTDPMLLLDKGRLRPGGHRTEPTALHGDGHLKCCPTVMGACAVLRQGALPGDEHLAGWHMAFEGQTVAEPVFGDNPSCVRCMPSLPHLLTRAEPGVLCVGHEPSAYIRIATEPASLGDETL